MWYSKFTNTAENLALLAGASKTSVLTFFKGKILDYDARLGPVTDAVIDKTWMVDVTKDMQAKPLAAAGETDKAQKLKDASRSPRYNELLGRYAIEKKRVDDAGFVTPGNVLGPLGAAAGDGNILDTAYDKVRRINFLKQISGKTYLMARFQARNVVNIVSTNDLNYKGFTDTTLLEGQPEIGDDQVPIPAKKSFGTFVKQIFADSFRYDLGTREQQDSQINIQSRFTMQIPGIMEKMINDKIIAIINAKSSAGGLGNWDALTNGSFDNDAAAAIEDAVNAIEDYDGSKVMIAPRKVIRLYKRNVQGRNVTTVDSLEPDNARSGKLPFNEDVTYYVDNANTVNEFTVISKDHFIDFYDGPQISVAAKNELTPNANIMNILFHYNGAKLKVDGSAQKNDSVY